MTPCRETATLEWKENRIVPFRLRTFCGFGWSHLTCKYPTSLWWVFLKVRTYSQSKNVCFFKGLKEFITLFYGVLFRPRFETQLIYEPQRWIGVPQSTWKYEYAHRNKISNPKSKFVILKSKIVNVARCFWKWFYSLSSGTYTVQWNEPS